MSMDHSSVVTVTVLTRGSGKSVILEIISFGAILKQFPKTFQIIKHFQSTGQSLFRIIYNKKKYNLNK